MQIHAEFLTPQAPSCLARCTQAPISPGVRVAARSSSTRTCSAEAIGQVGVHVTPIWPGQAMLTQRTCPLPRQKERPSVCHISDPLRNNRVRDAGETRQRI